MADLSMPTCAGDTTIPVDEPSELTAAIRVGERLLAHYGTVDGGDIFAYIQAHGGLAEALRLLLRALAAERGEQP
ncbi:hypothetical protein [Streptomyces sp. NPDC094149]|uniref:hypothetical protein n=1 Tax=Streptomyces sp. NPDC094149 TaxID=3155079 RepID=UPI003321DEC3